MQGIGGKRVVRNGWWKTGACGMSETFDLLNVSTSSPLLRTLLRGPPRRTGPWALHTSSASTILLTVLLTVLLRFPFDLLCLISALLRTNYYELRTTNELLLSLGGTSAGLAKNADALAAEGDEVGK